MKRQFSCFVAAAAALGAVSGCGQTPPPPQEESADPFGSVAIAMHGETGHDVTAVRFSILDASDPDGCDGTPVADVLSTLDGEGLPSFVDAGSGDTHPFSDGLFVLPPGGYLACAAPLAADGSASAHCSSASETATVVAEETTEVALLSQCEGDDDGGFDVILALNEPPEVEDLDADPSNFFSVCETATLVVTASDPNGDDLSYAWSVLEAPAGATPALMDEGDGRVSFASDTPGEYLIQVVISDEVGAETALEIPLTVADAVCIDSCQTVGDLLWCHHPTECGHACDDVCGALGLQSLADDDAWLEAQDTNAECRAIADAFGADNIQIGGFTNACAELIVDGLSPSSGTTLFCSNFAGCPANHRTAADLLGVDCAPGSSFSSICPCG